MKRILIIPLAIIVALFYSCEVLDNGKSGTPTERIEGAWSVDENSSLYKSALDIYQVYISLNPKDSTQVFIENFYQIGRDSEVRANVNGNSITIPNQSVDGFKISGSGLISSNFETINMIYDVDDGSGEIDEVGAVYTKIY